MSIEFSDIVCDTIDEYGMLKNTRNLIVGFSGGADSVSLLHFLNNFIKANNFENILIKAIHVNHCLRGDEAIRDANFSREFCEKNDIEFVLKEVNVKDFAKENKLSTEEAGRELRYKIFNEYANGENDKIAVAHTLSDSCETFMMNLIRGSGAKGLCGIPAVRGKIIRPLINVSRKQVEAYCQDKGLKYIHDSSNFERYYTRNKIRMDILPKMKLINSGLEKSLRRTMDLIKNDDEHLNEIAEKVFNRCKVDSGYDVNIIGRESYSIKSRVVLKIVREACECRNFDNNITNMILKVIDEKCGNVNISEDWSIYCNGELLILKKLSKKCLKKSYNYEIKIGKNILTKFETSVTIKIVRIDDYKKIKKDFKNIKMWGIDNDRIKGKCEFRNRCSGDKFSIKGRNVTKSVKKYFNELKIPVNLRDEILFLASGNDIIWSESWGVSSKYCVTDETKNVMILEIC